LDDGVHTIYFLLLTSPFIFVDAFPKAVELVVDNVGDAPAYFDAEGNEIRSMWGHVAIIFRFYAFLGLHTCVCWP